MAGFETPVFSTIAAFKREHQDLIERDIRIHYQCIQSITLIIHFKHILMYTK